MVSSRAKLGALPFFAATFYSGTHPMAVICPKCKAIRPPDAQVPDWQCPSCGIAYAKAAAPAAPAVAARAAAPASEGLGIGAKLFIALVLACAAFGGYRMMAGKSGGSVSSIAARLGSGASAGDLSALAGTVKSGDVVIYSASWCANCHAAKQWMSQYGFAYQDCDVEKDAGCASQFRATGSEGVPYLIVKGHHMKDGFDSDEFIAALRR
jgi:glutaredoxin